LKKAFISIHSTLKYWYDHWMKTQRGAIVMSKEKDQQIQSEDSQNKNKSSVQDDNNDQSLNLNKSSTNEFNDDFMKPFISNKADESKDMEPTETANIDKLSLSKRDEQRETSSAHTEADSAVEDVNTDESSEVEQTDENDARVVESETAGRSADSLGDAEDEVSGGVSEVIPEANREETLIAKPLTKDEVRSESNVPPEDNQATLIAEPLRRDEIEAALSERVQDSVEEEETEEEQSQIRKNRKKKPKGRIRLIPIWVRLVFIIAALLGSLILGAMIGYGIVGEGGNPFDVLNEETWYHIYDMIFDGTERQR